MGEGNHRLLEDEEFVGQCLSEPHFTMHSLGGFPGVVENGSTAIVGEVFSVAAEAWKNVEYLEGYPDFYDRITVHTEFGEAEMYVLKDTEYQTAPVIEGGDWLER
jgi:gamma-glutamylcyclotransferase (GGCT)/AIG2-like uncharacterized protein YtfP